MIRLLVLLLPLAVYAKTAVVFDAGAIDFTNSKQKKNGVYINSYFHLGTKKETISFLYSKTDTQTYQPPLPSNLHVNKLFLRYYNKPTPKTQLLFGIATVDDNLAKEVDDGVLYTIGVKYSNWDYKGYLSDYNRFKVYQSDIFYHFNYPVLQAVFRAVLGAKYIHLDNKNSNSFSKNAKNSYTTAKIQCKLDYNGFSLLGGALFGKRVFSIMKDSYAWQHHAMEFYKTYMGSVATKGDRWHIALHYSYQKAKELPINNDNVTVENIGVAFMYRF